MRIRRVNQRQIFYFILLLLILFFYIVNTHEITRLSPQTPPELKSLEAPRCYIPEWRYSRSKGRYSYGGFTADMGWILMVTRYALSDNNARMKFPRRWGHGPGGWTDMFVQPYDGLCSEVIPLLNSDSRIRHQIKFKDYYTERSEYKLHPNRGIQDFFDIVPRDPTNDLVTMRRLFKYTFRLNSEVWEDVQRALIDEMMYSGPYVGVHIRWGDKIGRGSEDSDPRESTYIPVTLYADEIRENTNVTRVFVATDDYRAVQELRMALGDRYTVYTRARSGDRGFSITRYFKRERADLDVTKNLWIDMEILSRSELFIGNFESNVARMVHLMRDKKSLDIMNVYRGKAQWTCCNNRYQNCFWFCK